MIVWNSSQKKLSQKLLIKTFIEVAASKRLGVILSLSKERSD